MIDTLFPTDRALAFAATEAGGGAPKPPQPMQLRMRRPNLDDLPPLTVPSGYSLRTYRPGDEAAWAEIMNSEGGIGTGWTPDLVRARLIDQPQFDPVGLFFATCDAENGRPVASATAWRVPPEETRTGCLHMVAALPEHRGHGLGRMVNLAVLRYFRDRGFGDIVLSTDDFRVAAVRCYLSLGFVPVYRDDPASDHPTRWSAVFARVMALPLSRTPRG